MTYTLRPYQQEAVDFALPRLKKDPKPLLMVLGTGAGKCFDPNTMILMGDGTTKRIKDVKTGEKVQSQFRANTVIGSHSGIDKRYRIVPTHSEPFIVSADHVMVVYDTIQKKIVNIKIEDLLTAKHYTSGLLWRYRLVHCPVEYEERQVFIPPYILGVWLGDGTSRDTYSLTTMDTPIKQAWVQYGQLFGLQAKTYRKDIPALGRWSKAETVVLTRAEYSPGTKNPIEEQFDKYKLKNNKHIPIEYLANSRNIRLELLAGILDTDGCFSHSGVCEIIQKRENLAKQIAQLARGLGFRANVHIKIVDNVNYYRVNISGTNEMWAQVPFRVKKPTHRNSQRAIDKECFCIETLDDGEYFGIQVDGDNRFLLADNTLVHNTWVLAEIAKKWGGKVLILTLSKELCEQDYEKLRIVVGDKGVGMFSASWKRKEVENITVATVQSAYRHPELWEDYQLVIYDECDTSVDGMVATLIKGKRVLGLTATAYATQGSRKGKWFTTKLFPLHKIKTKIGWFWQPVEFCRSEKYLLDAGYLCPLKIYSTPVECHLLKTNSNGSEYTSDSINRWAMAIYKRIIEVMQGAEKHNMCTSGLVFMPSVESCQNLVEWAKKEGLSVGMVCAKTPAKERDAIVEAHKNGQLRWLINQNVCVRGFDNPRVDCLVCARPTRSLRLWRQLIGRGLRLSEGKTVCNVLDLTENAKTWGGPEDVEMGKNGWQDTILLRGKDISGMEVSRIDLAKPRNTTPYIPKINDNVGFTTRRIKK